MDDCWFGPSAAIKSLSVFSVLLVNLLRKMSSLKILVYPQSIFFRSFLLLWGHLADWSLKVVLTYAFKDYFPTF